MSRLIFIPPHTDGQALEILGKGSSKSNQCSVVFGLLTNNENTNWYTYLGNFDIRTMNPFKLRKEKSICVQKQEAYLYDNSSIHSVTGGKFFKDRCLLSFTWHNITYDELNVSYNKYKSQLTNNDNTDQTGC